MPKAAVVEAPEHDVFADTAVLAQSFPVNPDAPITTDQLLSLLQTMAAAQNQSSENQARLMADAIVAAQKPYVDPKKEENDKIFKEQNRRQMEQDRHNKHANQKYCPHIAGCNPLSEVRDHANRTSIIWHVTDSTETIGICTNCQRVFHENDPDYAEWRQKPSYNRMSKSGQREYADPLAARERARS